MFTTCTTTDQLKGFIIALEFKDVPKALPTRIKTKLKPAQVLKAFDIQKNPVILCKNTVTTIESETINEDQSEEENEMVPDNEVIDLSADDHLPSYWLQNSKWRELVCST